MTHVRVELLPPDRAPPTSPLVRSLRARTHEAAAFFSPVPDGPAEWSSAMREAAARAPRPAPALVDSILRRQRDLGAGPCAEAHAALLGEAGTLALVTGQQPGLLGGALLAFHKAAGVVALARRLDGLDGHRVVPVFWLASEDHDFDEANRLLLLDRDGSPRRLALPGEADGRSLMHRALERGDAQRLLQDAADVLPDTPRARAVLESLEPSSGDDFATWSARCFLQLLGDAGLVLVEPSVLLPHAGDVLAELLLATDPIGEALAAAGRALGEAGIEAPLEPRATQPILFLRDRPGGVRRRVEVRAGRILGRDGADVGSLAQVADLLRKDPARGSGDAVGRVFVQDRLLPVLGYAGGPTELAYHAQVRAAHQAVGVPYPLALPRPEATWADAKAERAAQAFGTSLARLLADPSALARVARQADAQGDELEPALEAWIRSVEGTVTDLAARVPSDGEGARSIGQAAERLGKEARREADRIRAAIARDRGVGADRRRRIEDLLWPRGRPQERGLSPVSLAARHGVEALREGWARLEPLAPGHHLIHLSS